MCGIAGFYLREGMADESIVRLMCDQIQHRGPDDDGYHVDGACAIGMRRLSIIDLSTGHQPISNEDGRIWTVFNGEIYNFQELRDDLIARGHSFRTNSDTETLVHLYEQTGGGWEKLRGMFAYAIWDSRERSLTIARDRFGKKPLYYAITDKGLFFGSELKCLRAAGVPLEIDKEALRLYFQFLYIPDPWSAYKGVRKLPPGGWLKYHHDGRVEQGLYWRLPRPVEQPLPGDSAEAARTRIRDTFDESVRIRMIADVPLGAFLSGGIDSTSVVASMALQSSEPVKTFSIGFEESAYNELTWARMVAAKYGAEHHEIMVKPDAVDLIQRLIHFFDEPFADSSAIPTYIVSEFAARHVKVALTGDGGDELFAGYPSFLHAEKLRNWNYTPQILRQMIAWVADQLPYSAYGKNYLRMISRSTTVERYFELNTTPYFLRSELLQPSWMLPCDEAFFLKTFSSGLLESSADDVSQALFFEATVKLTGDMLTKVDRMSMANSLEVRCPLLDHELAAVAMNIPHSWKMKNGGGKQILIEALGDRLPPELLSRPKQGFGVPLPIWFRGALREMLWDYLTSRRFLERGLVSPEFVRTFLEEHQSGRRDNSHYLWMLLVCELWFRGMEDVEPQTPHSAASLVPQKG
jgi:asparagine synthase (glutamine-hydrolysing)